MFVALDDSSLLTSFQVILLENIVMCHISTGNKVAAIQQISHLKFICLQDSRLYHCHRSQLHTLLVSLSPSSLSPFSLSLLWGEREGGVSFRPALRGCI